MNQLQNLLSVAIIAAFALWTFGLPYPSQAAPTPIVTEQFSCADVTEIPQSECEVLVAIYNINANRPSRWLQTTTPCSWSGITCRSGHIAGLSLSWSSLNSLPPEIVNLNNLTSLDLSWNFLNSLPPEIVNLNSLTALGLSWNFLNSLPPEIANLNNLASLNLSANEFSSLPPEIVSMTNLTTLNLSANKFSSLPPEIENLNNLTSLSLGENQLSSLPTEIKNLTNLQRLSLDYNRLMISDNDLLSFVVEYDEDWARTQTVAPTNVKATALNEESIELTWTPIAFQGKWGGYYEISLADEGSFVVYGTTESRWDSSYVVGDLVSGTTYDIRIRTYMPTHNGNHPYPELRQKNELWSDYSPTISATIPISMNTPTAHQEDWEPLGYKFFLPLIDN